MKTIVLGAGYLGSEFKRRGYDVRGRDFFNAQSLNSMPLSKLDDFNVIINCIGNSDTRWCEDPNNFEKAMFVNAYVPKILSDYCKLNNKKFVHISTGCLYDKNNSSENDNLVSHCNYTVTKFAAERLIDPSRDLIIRPRLLFSDIINKKNLLVKLPNFNHYIYDKWDSLTCTTTIVEAVQKLLDNNQIGVFNVANDGNASIFDIASWCGWAEYTKIIGIDDLREEQGLYLVNNTMRLEKLKQFYQPPKLKDIIIDCFSKLYV